MLPFVMPTLVAGMGVLALFGTNGAVWAGWQDTPYLLIYGNVFFNLPVLVRAAYQGFLQVPEARLQTAQALGAGSWMCIGWILWLIWGWPLWMIECSWLVEWWVMRRINTGRVLILLG